MWDKTWLEKELAKQMPAQHNAKSRTRDKSRSNYYTAQPSGVNEFQSGGDKVVVMTRAGNLC